MAGVPIPGGAVPEVPIYPTYASTLLGELPTAKPPSCTGAPSTPSPRFNPIDLPARKYSHHDGFPVIHFTPQEFSAGAKLFQHSLVAKFTMGRPSISEIREVFKRNWNIEGRATISDIWDSRHLFIILDSEVDVKKALVCPIRKIGHAFFRLFRYSTDYDHRKESTVTTKWIRLPGLPLPFYNVNFIGGIVNAFADFLDVDARTKACTSLKFARCCVEIDVSQKIPSQVKISVFNGQEFWQSIEVEGSLDYCDHCLIHGHTSKVCRKYLRKKDNIVSQSSKAQPVVIAPQSLPVVVPCQDNATQWQVVAPRKKKNKKKKKLSMVNSEPLDIGTHVTTKDSHAETLGSSQSHDIIKESIGLDGTSIAAHAGVGTIGSLMAVVPTRGEFPAGLGCGASAVLHGTSASAHAGEGTLGSLIAVDPTRLNVLTLSAVQGTTACDTLNSSLASPISHPIAAVVGPKSPNSLALCSKPSSSAASTVGTLNGASDFRSELSPIIQGSSRHGTSVQLNVSATELHSHNPNGSLASPVGQVAPCDSIELLRKKLGRKKSVVVEEDFEPNEAIALEPKVAQKIAKYGDHIFAYDQGSPINARDYYLGIKAHYGEKDSQIFRVMDIIYNEAMQAMNEGSPAEESDGSIDLSRIIKNPRQKPKGSRRSGRSCSKKCDSNLVY